MGIGGNFRKVNRGDKLRIPAITWNNILEVVESIRRNVAQIGAGQPTSSIDPRLTVYIRNSTGADLTKNYNILRVDGTVYNHADKPNDSNRQIALDGFIPTASDNPIVISQGPINEDKLERACISGVTLCRILMTDDSHEWANPVDGETEYLESSTSGQARILWHGFPTGDEWVGSGSGPPEPEELGSGIEWAIVHLIGSNNSDCVPFTCQDFYSFTYTDGNLDPYQIWLYGQGSAYNFNASVVYRTTVKIPAGKYVKITASVYSVVNRYQFEPPPPIGDYYRYRYVAIGEVDAGASEILGYPVPLILYHTDVYHVMPNGFYYLQDGIYAHKNIFAILEPRDEDYYIAIVHQTSSSPNEYEVMLGPGLTQIIVEEICNYCSTPHDVFLHLVSGDSGDSGSGDSGSGDSGSGEESGSGDIGSPPFDFCCLFGDEWPSSLEVEFERTEVIETGGGTDLTGLIVPLSFNGTIYTSGSVEGCESTFIIDIHCSGSNIVITMSDEIGISSPSSIHCSLVDLGADPIAEIVVDLVSATCGWPGNTQTYRLYIRIPA